MVVEYVDRSEKTPEANREVHVFDEVGALCIFIELKLLVESLAKANIGNVFPTVSVRVPPCELTLMVHTGQWGGHKQVL